MNEGFIVISGNASTELKSELNEITKISEIRYKDIKTANHEWVNILDDAQFKKYIDNIRYSETILNKIKEEFPNTNVSNVTEGDEIYWAVSPKDAKGSDRSLVDCHYDSPFVFFPTFGVIYYRVIIATNENNDVTTVFPHENKKVKMSTGDFHGLDYNKDWHCVEGQIPPDKYRILLKLHYLIVPPGSEPYANYVKSINVWWTQVSREAMRMSANPKTFTEYIVALIVNISRIVFNHGYLFLLLFITLILAFTKYGRKLRKNFLMRWKN
jgi:hypothetical protein